MNSKKLRKMYCNEIIPKNATKLLKEWVVERRKEKIITYKKLYDLYFK